LHTFAEAVSGAVNVDKSSSWSCVDDPMRHAQWLSRSRRRRRHNAQILSLWWHRQRRQPHGVHRKTFVYTPAVTRRYRLSWYPYTSSFYFFLLLLVDFGSAVFNGIDSGSTWT